MSGDGRRARVALSILTILVAAVALLGWVEHIPLAETVLPSLTTMKANTAVALALSAAGLLLGTRPLAASAAGVLAAAIGAATLLEYLFGARLGLDEALFADPATTSMPFPGRMSPETAVALIAIGCGIPLLAVGRTRAQLMAAHARRRCPAPSATSRSSATSTASIGSTMAGLTSRSR